MIVNGFKIIAVPGTPDDTMIVSPNTFQRLSEAQAIRRAEAVENIAEDTIAGHWLTEKE